MKFGNAMENFEAKKTIYTNLVKDDNSTQEQRENAFNDMFAALQEDLTSKISKEARNELHDAQILTARGQNVLTAEERQFFNQVIDGGFNDESTLPVTTQNRVFEDLVQAHPLLDTLGIQNLGAVTKFIYSDPTKAFGWKEIFGDITGQSNVTFSEEEFSQLKLTSYVVIPNDMLELGPEWIERYVRELLVEVISAGLEYGFVNGRGAAQKEPVGLMKNVDKVTGAVTDKTSSGTLTFAPSAFGETISEELYNVISALSVDEDGNAVKTNGKVVMLTNPVDSIALQFRNTIQTANGQWVMALPYNIQPVESDEVPAGKAVFFVKGRYLAAIAGGYKLKKFEQTFALEDATLYTIKQFANGRPKDNKSALIYDLAIQFGTETP